MKEYGFRTRQKDEEKRGDFGDENYGDGGRIINKRALKAHGSGNHTL